MTLPAPSEAEVLRSCLSYLALKRVFAWRNNNAAIRRTDPAGRQWMQFSGLRGAADILGILPPNGRLLAVECKGPRGRLTVDQTFFLDTIRSAGGLALCVHCVDELILALNAEGVRT